MTWVVDTCVILDILEGKTDFARKSALAIRSKLDDELVIAPITYVELAPAFNGNVAERTIRLQASSVDMDQTLHKADELSRVKGDFVIRSSHDTASGKTEITVRRHSPVVYIVMAIAGLILLTWLMR